jgi:23S rRNA pseudouridine2605 synthase
MAMRLAKAIRDSGYCSRRDAEKVIEEGRVKVDNKIIETPAYNVDESNKIAIDGKVIKSIQTARLWLYYKPVGLITTHKDPQERPTVFENLPPKLPRVVSVGRLDINSEGLLLLTNSAALARKFELPSNEYERTYKVRVFGTLDMNRLSKATSGIRVEGVYYKPKSFKLLGKSLNNSQSHANHWIEVVLTEGKNREIRNLLSYFGLKVNRLIRKSFGPWELGDLKQNELIEVNIDEKL